MSLHRKRFANTFRVLFWVFKKSDFNQLTVYFRRGRNQFRMMKLSYDLSVGRAGEFVLVVVGRVRSFAEH